MKRFSAIIALALAVVLCLSCSGGGGSKHFVIGFSQCANDAWRLKQNEEILQEAMFYNDIDVIIRSAGGDNAVQQKDIEWFIREGVDLLIVSPNEAAPITPYVDKAFERGIPVIVVDRKILSDSYSAFVGADNYQIGKSIGLYVSKLLHNGGDIVELSGLVGSTPAMERHDGFISEISKHSNLKLLCSRDAQWVRSAAYSEMMEVLSKYNDIDLVFCHNDDMAYGAYMAAKSVGQEKKMLFVGIDALSGEEGGVALVLNDVLDATFIYPSGGDVIMRVASKILHGEDYPRNNTLNTSLVNKNNAKIRKLVHYRFHGAGFAGSPVSVKENIAVMPALNEASGVFDNGVSLHLIVFQIGKAYLVEMLHSSELTALIDERLVVCEIRGTVLLHVLFCLLKAYLRAAVFVHRKRDILGDTEPRSEFTYQLIG